MYWVLTINKIIDHKNTCNESSSKLWDQFYFSKSVETCKFEMSLTQFLQSECFHKMVNLRLLFTLGQERAVVVVKWLACVHDFYSDDTSSNPAGA